MIIDDDEEMRRSLQEFLQRRAYQADVARNVREALFRLWTGRYALALTDISMPEMSGLSLISVVKTLPVAVDFVVMTGNDSTENREEAQRLGAKGFVVKPFELDRMLSIIEMVLKQSDRSDL